MTIGLLACVLLGSAGGKTGHPKISGMKNLFARTYPTPFLEAGSWVMEKGLLSAKDAAPFDQRVLWKLCARS